MSESRNNNTVSVEIPQEPSSARLYVRSDDAGKQRLVVVWSGGAEQVIVAE